MSKQSNLPGKYFRAGIALANDKKPILDEKLGELGLNSVGQLVNLFVMVPGASEALKPFAAQLKSMKAETTPKFKRAEVKDAIKGLTPDELMALVELAKQKKAAEQQQEAGA